MDYAIKVSGVTKRFGELIAVDNVSFKIPEGKIFGLLGSNGAGKTTIINMLTGLLIPDEGSINILGMSALSKIEDIRKQIAFVPQTISLYEDLTVYENMEFFGGLYIDKKSELKIIIEKMIKNFELEQKRNSKISELSGGYQRRCSIACALISQPRILFLDEPLTGIDIQTRELVRNLLNSLKNTTIIITTHSIKEAEAICDYVVFLDDGKKIIEGRPSELVKKYSQILGESISIEFDVFLDAEKIGRYLKKYHLDIYDLKVSEKTVTFRSKNLGRGMIDLINSIRYFRSHILNIDIKKQRLEDIFEYVMENKDEID